MGTCLVSRPCPCALTLGPRRACRPAWTPDLEGRRCRLSETAHARRAPPAPAAPEGLAAHACETAAIRSRWPSLCSRVTPWCRAQAATKRSVAGTVTPFWRAKRASAAALSHTGGSISRQGSSLSISLSTVRSRSPRAPFHSSRRTIGHQAASAVISSVSTRPRTVASPSRRSCSIHEEVSTSVISRRPSPRRPASLRSRRSVRNHTWRRT